MDFIEGLPKSSTYVSILVVVDKFLKYPYFIKLSYPFTAFKVAKLYMDHVYKLHGMPATIAHLGQCRQGGPVYRPVVGPNWMR